jgi:hypothetical protein
MEKLERFLLARCRGGSQLSANTAVGVRVCDVSIITMDLKERGLYIEGTSEMEQRREMEARLRLEDEKKQMKVLMQDRRFEGRGGKVSDDIGRVIIDTLHAPMRAYNPLNPLL